MSIYYGSSEPKSTEKSESNSSYAKEHKSSLKNESDKSEASISEISKSGNNSNDYLEPELSLKSYDY